MFLNVPWQQRVTHTHTHEPVHGRRVGVENLSWQGQKEKSSEFSFIDRFWLSQFQRQKKNNNSSYQHQMLFVNYVNPTFFSTGGHNIATMKTSKSVNRSWITCRLRKRIRHKLTITPAATVFTTSCWVMGLIGRGSYLSTFFFKVALKPSLLTALPFTLYLGRAQVGRQPSEFAHTEPRVSRAIRFVAEKKEKVCNHWLDVSHGVLGSISGLSSEQIPVVCLRLD